MIYRTPALSARDERVLSDIEELRTQLRYYLREPRRWYGTLRRATLARAMQGSNSIEGYHASVEDVAALIEHEEPLGADEETRQAIAGYRDAMTYILQLTASRPMVPLDESLVRALHFMMLKYDLAKNPGQWRPGAVWIQDADGHTVYEAPAREELDALLGETLAGVNDGEGEAIVRAAMGHLNFVLVHPFSDGNGRMARCVQSYVLASEGILSSEFLSIEEYLGRNTRTYYDVLTQVAQGAWSPQNDARPWLEFCLTAHFRQAGTLLRRIQETEALWDQCEQLARRHKLPDRCVGALCDASRGWRLRRSLYVKTVQSSAGEAITDETATRDLRGMANAGLLEPLGEKRGRQYVATPNLRVSWENIRSQRPARGVDDPYSLAQPTLPGLTD
ncbi:MAG TPA: Fic family protein [Acidimicrobiales bacterium]|nr:Fic family protein [Acidimicrobiales bacterium]